MNKTLIFSDNSLRELVNFREDIFNSYAKKGYSIHLIAPKNSIYQPLYPNIHIHSPKLSRSGVNPFSDILYFVYLLKTYRRLKPSFIFHYTVKPNIYGSIAAKILGIPSVAMIAGLGFLFGNSGFRGRIGRILYKFALKFPEKIFVLNEMNRDFIISNHFAKESQIIFLPGGEGINLKKFN